MHSASIFMAAMHDLCIAELPYKFENVEGGCTWRVQPLLVNLPWFDGTDCIVVSFDCRQLGESAASSQLPPPGSGQSCWASRGSGLTAASAQLHSTAITAALHASCMHANCTLKPYQTCSARHLNTLRDHGGGHFPQPYFPCWQKSTPCTCVGHAPNHAHVHHVHTCTKQCTCASCIHKRPVTHIHTHIYTHTPHTRSHAVMHQTTCTCTWQLPSHHMTITWPSHGRCNEVPC